MLTESPLPLSNGPHPGPSSSITAWVLVQRGLQPVHACERHHVEITWRPTYKEPDRVFIDVDRVRRPSSVAGPKLFAVEDLECFTLGGMTGSKLGMVGRHKKKDGRQ
jgi:hypothetical protein